MPPAAAVRWQFYLATQLRQSTFCDSLSQEMSVLIVWHYDCVEVEFSVCLNLVM